MITMKFRETILAPLKAVMAVVLFIMAGVGLFAFTVWSQRPGSLPSSFFRQLDRNHDGDVSFAEWKATLETKSDWLQREWDFRSMDCNDDERVTWREYKNDVFKRRKCERTAEAALALGERPRSPDSFGGCWTDPFTGAQTCVAGTSSGAWESARIADPMQKLTIPD